MKKIQLTQGQFALVDDWNYEKLNRWKWCAAKNRDGSFYALRRVYSKETGKQHNVYMHRFIMNTPDNLKCDHADRCRLNNQEYNLRNCTNSQNAMNSKKSTHGKSKYKGVSILNKKDKQVFYVSVWKNKKKMFGKTVHSEIEGAILYDKMAKIYHGEFARINFPN